MAFGYLHDGIKWEWLKRAPKMYSWIWIFILAAGILFVVKIAYVICTALVLPITRGALYVSTSRVRIAAFMDAVPMRAGQLLVDIGCGDGRVLRKARKRYGVKAIGYELNLLAYLKAKLFCLAVKEVKVADKKKMNPGVP